MTNPNNWLNFDEFPELLRNPEHTKESFMVFLVTLLFPIKINKINGKVLLTLTMITNKQSLNLKLKYGED